MIVVQDGGTRSRLAAMYLPRWRAYLSQTGGEAVLRGERGPGPARAVRLADEYARSLGEIPVHLLVAVRLADLAVTDAGLPRQSIVGGASIYPFVQNLLLALRAEGLGAAMSTLLVPAEEEIRSLLAIPEGYALAAHVSVGHRADPWPARLSREPVSAFAFSERWGEPLGA